jgi:hypothetical protein
MLCVVNKPILLSAVMLNVVMLSVVALNKAEANHVIIQNVHCDIKIISIFGAWKQFATKKYHLKF